MTDGQTDGRTDGRTEFRQQYRAYASQSHGKNEHTFKHFCYTHHFLSASYITELVRYLSRTKQEAQLSAEKARI